MSNYKVITAPYLGDMLLKHIRFISNVSLPAAKRFRIEFAELIQRIAENPYQFPIIDDSNLPRDVYRKALFAKWYKAAFYVEGNCVYRCSGRWAAKVGPVVIGPLAAECAIMLADLYLCNKKNKGEER